MKRKAEKNNKQEEEEDAKARKTRKHEKEECTLCQWLELTTRKQLAEKLATCAGGTLCASLGQPIPKNPEHIVQTFSSDRHFTKLKKVAHDEILQFHFWQGGQAGLKKEIQQMLKERQAKMAFEKQRFIELNQYGLRAVEAWHNSACSDMHQKVEILQANAVQWSTILPVLYGQTFKIGGYICNFWRPSRLGPSKLPQHLINSTFSSAPIRTDPFLPILGRKLVPDLFRNVRIGDASFAEEVCVLFEWDPKNRDSYPSDGTVFSTPEIPQHHYRFRFDWNSNGARYIFIAKEKRQLELLLCDARVLFRSIVEPLLQKFFYGKFPMSLTRLLLSYLNTA
jgi:hypothetical protein